MAVYEFDGYRLDTEQAVLFYGNETKLTGKALQLFVILFENKGKFFHTESLLDLVWSDTEVNENNVKQCIKDIRKALGDSGKTQKYIETESGVGYRFISPTTDPDEQLQLGSQQSQEASVDFPSESRSRSGTAPQPGLIIGREEALGELKKRLGVNGERPSENVQVLTAVRGLPGIGKTTLCQALAQEKDVVNAFDNILWTALGQKPDLLGALAAWGRSFGIYDLIEEKTVEKEEERLTKATERLTAVLSGKRVLLIVDDVWAAKHVNPFRVGGRNSAMLITTRDTEIAANIAPRAEDVYKLDLLSDKAALELFRLLAPQVYKEFPEQSRELVLIELEGLPLAIQVAGRLLNAEASYNLGVDKLLVELREGAKILQSDAPSDVASETTPTVAALLKKSTDVLAPDIRDRYARLGVFAPKPATFALKAMKGVWKLDDPSPIVRELIRRGLLEVDSNSGRFQMHALLVMHAKSLLST